MIEINNLTALQINEKILKKIVGKVLIGENKKKASLSIAFIGEKRMKSLNKKYRNKNKATDVLAFSGDSLPVNLNIKNRSLGEIVICFQEIKKNAKKFKTDFKKELKRILIHGVLHLLGYDHEKGDLETKKMKKKEEYYFTKINN